MMNPRDKGTLFIVSTPIGNMEDITLRAIRTLKEVDLIACEDTRQTLKLLTKHGIRNKLISYYQPRERQRLPLILEELEKGRNVALVSDSGTPAISDPGFRLVHEAITRNMRIVPIPGASALASALSASGLPTHRFLFLGFPPPKREKIKKLLASLTLEQGTLVFYLPTRKIQEFLSLILETLGDRRVVIAREMTKIYEEFIRSNAGEALEALKNKTLKGEATVLVEGAKVD